MFAHFRPEPFGLKPFRKLRIFEIASNPVEWYFKEPGVSSSGWYWYGTAAIRALFEKEIKWALRRQRGEEW